MPKEGVKIENFLYRLARKQKQKKKSVVMCEKSGKNGNEQKKHKSLPRNLKNKPALKNEKNTDKNMRDIQIIYIKK